MKMACVRPLIRIMLALMPGLLLPCKGCNDGWFGEDCKFQCHCFNEKTCKMNGDCSNNAMCESGYFGPACQFIDILANGKLSSADQYLRDSDDATCNPNAKATSVTFSFSQPTSITWFRMILSDSVFINNFTTSFGDNDVCLNVREMIINYNTVDVFCRQTINAPSMEISGPTAAKICTLQISGGRNVAVKQFATHLESFMKLDRYQASHAVDGNTDPNPDNEHCAFTFSERLMPTLDITLNEIYMLTKIRVFASTNHAQDLKGVIIEGFNEFGNKTFENQNTRTNQPMQYDIELPSLPIVKTIVVRKPPTEGNDSKLLSVCELQAFGDCIEGTYGLSCDKNCSVNCADICNHVSGKCTCIKGFGGDRCDGCLPTFYGATCDKRCPTNCLKNLCNAVTGNCHGCSDDSYEGSKCDSEKSFYYTSLTELIIVLVIVLVLVPLIVCCIFCGVASSMYTCITDLFGG